MTLLKDGQIAEEIGRACNLAGYRAWIASAFCRSEAFSTHVSDLQASCVDKFIVVRWQARDLLSGASDLQLYPTASDLGWQVYLNPKVHAKAYLFDDIGIMGSANLTGRGLSGAEAHGNIELASITLDPNDLSNWFTDLRSKSRLLDNQLFEAIAADVKGLESGSVEAVLNRGSFSASTMALLATGSKVGLYTNDLFWSSSPSALLAADRSPDAQRNAEHDLEILNLGSDVSESKIVPAFLSSAAYRWLCSTISSEVYFGSLTNSLHTELLDDPSPYRKEVKELTSNLVRWTKELAPDAFGVDRPNHSQRIFRHITPTLEKRSVEIHSKNLSEDEWAIILLVYLNNREIRLTASHPAVRALSRVLNRIAALQRLPIKDGFRSPDGLRGRLDVFSLFDGQITQTRALRPVKSAEDVWGRYIENKEQLVGRVEKLLEDFDVDVTDRTAILDRI